MPTMGTNRLVLLSMVKYLQAELTNSGWSSVTFVKEYPDDDKKVVLSGTGSADEVVIPAVSIYQGGSNLGSAIGIGNTVYKHMNNWTIFLYARSDGQEIDLRDFITKRLRWGNPSLYDFSASGYPGTGSEESLGSITIDNVSSRPVYLRWHQNAALRYGGAISFSTEVDVN